MPESRVIPLGPGRSSAESNEEPSCLMMFLHNNLLQLDLGLGCIIVWAEVHLKLALEGIPIPKPDRLGRDLAEDGRLKILKRGAR